ncbi:MAG: Holliday junction branch migration protein RuvA [Myxococcota bacterium]
MIGWLRGVVRHRDDGVVILDVGGVGYEVHVPLGTGADVAVGGDLELWIHTQVREDLLALFGFEELSQRAVFDVLISVSGVGPKLAVGILGDISVAALHQAVETGDVKRLKKVSGIGARLAERLGVELKGKLGKIAGSAGISAVTPAATRQVAGDVWGDIESALTNLQYRPVEVQSALSLVRREHPEATDFDMLLRASLAALRR